MNKIGSKNLKIGFIGCGKMASAIIKGIINSQFIEASQIIASEISEEFAQKQSETLGICVSTDNKIIAKDSDVIFIATKPNMVREVLNEMKPYLTSNKLIVSIAAGVKTNSMEEIVENIPVIRVMPNAPLLVSEGMCGIVKGRYANQEDLDFVYELLSKMGKCLIVDEDKIDVLTALSGSGPAFFYKTIHEMALAGEKLGLDYQKSLLLAAQTAIGSAKIMLNTELSPTELVANIATKGGCTAVGVSVMDENNTESLFYEVIKQTTDKATALGS